MIAFKSTSTDMATIINTFLPDYRQRYKLTPGQASVCQSIIQCQTEALGGEQRQCTACGYQQALYHIKYCFLYILMIYIMYEL